MPIIQTKSTVCGEYEAEIVEAVANLDEAAFDEEEAAGSSGPPDRHCEALGSTSSVSVTVRLCPQQWSRRYPEATPDSCRRERTKDDGRVVPIALPRAGYRLRRLSLTCLSMYCECSRADH